MALPTHLLTLPFATPQIALILSAKFVTSLFKLRITTYSVVRAASAHDVHRGSYMSVHVLLNLLNGLGKRDKMRGLSSILSLFRNELNKFNNTRARMLDSIYHMTLRYL